MVNILPEPPEPTEIVDLDWNANQVYDFGDLSTYGQQCRAQALDQAIELCRTIAAHLAVLALNSNLLVIKDNCRSKASGATECATAIEELLK
jgi:hypothetical protein